MNALTIHLPDSLRRQLQSLADQEGVSIDQLATSAVTEKIAALMSPEYLAQRAERGKRGTYERALSKIQDSEPDPYDAQ